VKTFCSDPASTSSVHRNTRHLTREILRDVFLHGRAIAGIDNLHDLTGTGFGRALCGGQGGEDEK
jgi:hypothetical protein